MNEELTQTTDEMTNENLGENATNTAAEEEQQQQIPPELEGLPEDIQREAMKEVSELSQEDKAEETTNETQQTPPQTYTYEQYKAKDDELNALKAQFEEYRRKAETPPPIRAQPQVQQPAQIKFTSEMAKEFNQLVEERAMEMTGYTKDDISEFEFAENDNRLETYKYAKDIAKNEILTAIQQAQINEITRQQQLQSQQAANIKSYNDFASQVMKEPDFADIQAYAINEGFNKLDEQDRLAVSGAYYRIEHQTANATDIALIKNYFKQAANEYRSQNKTKGTNTSKIKQAEKLPKIDNISGGTGKGEPTVADLERMIDESEDVTKIPEKYRRIIAGY